MDHIEDAKKRRKEGKTVQGDARNTLIEHLLTSDMLPESEKATSRLTGEFIAILSGGTMTTARTLSTITYFVLADSTIQEKLREALAGPMSGYPEKMPRWADLERIPYVAACVKEGLRYEPSDHGISRKR